MSPIQLRNLLSFFLIASVLTAGWWVSPGAVDGIPLCFWKWKFHIDCPGCGLTHSFLALAKGRLGEAFGYNAAGPFIYALFLFWLVDLGRKILGQKREIALPVRWVQGYGLLVFILLFGHWVVRVQAQIPSLFG